MELIISIFVGLGLSATCGFRVFVPFLGLSLCARFDVIPLAEDFLWLNSDWALVVLSVATVLEVLAYALPWFDNLMDAITTPLTVIAGVILTATLVGDLDPVYRWGLAIVAGGGVAGTVQVSNVLLRGASTAATGGLANFLVALYELLLAIVGTLLSIFVPLLMAAVIFVLFVIVVRRRLKKTA